MNETKNFPKVTNLRWYPLYHIAAPSGWVNDPNGFCFFGGKYHFFYQYHPYSPQWGPMHWGHAVSADLVHWEHLPIALAPEKNYDKDGCFSGSGIEADGKFYLMYTGHVTLPEKNADGLDSLQMQCLAVSEDGVHFQKAEENPIIVAPKSDKIHGGDFRDPKVWKHGEKFYAVIGSRTADGTRGQVLLYESENLVQWKLKNISAKSEGNQGNMWECPNFAEVDDGEALIVSPMGIEPEGNKFLNNVQSGYFLGKLDYETGIFSHGEFDLLDYGFDFYAPQVTKAPDGRCILIGWLDMWHSPMPEQADGWAGMMTVPRELHIKSGKLFSEPARELETLRGEKKSYKNLTLNSPQKLDGISGEVGELLLTIDATESKNFSVELRSSAEEKTILSFDADNKIFKLNRDKSGSEVGGVRETKISPCAELNLRIFLDRSSVEIFINGGERVLSARIYPQSSSRDIIFVPENSPLKLNEIIFYELGQGIPQVLG